MKRFLIIVYTFLVVCATLLLSSYLTKDKTTEVKLGETLFFDKILSSDQTLSCGSCHIPAFAFADTVSFSKGVQGRITQRNTPSVMNIASREFLFWDGRANTLEQQVVGPIENPNEMNLPFATAVQRIQASKK